jgi:hypothetical protein
MNPSRPFCQPEKTGGESELPPAKEKREQEGLPRKGSGKVRANGNPAKKEIHLSMMDRLPIRKLARGKINPLPALTGRAEGLLVEGITVPGSQAIMDGGYAFFIF